MKKELTYVATCLLGVEGLVANELKFMGAKDVTPENGRVIFKGDYNILARANICSPICRENYDSFRHFLCQNI